MISHTHTHASISFIHLCVVAVQLILELIPLTLSLSLEFFCSGQLLEETLGTSLTYYRVTCKQIENIFNVLQSNHLH